MNDYRVTPTQVAVVRDGRTVTVERYYACVRTARGAWAFCGKRAPYRSRNTAQRVCDRHRRLWQRVVRLASTSGHRLKRLEAIVAASRPKRRPWYKRPAIRRAYLIPDPLTVLPAWAAVELDESFLRLLARARTNVLKSEARTESSRA